MLFPNKPQLKEAIINYSVIPCAHAIACILKKKQDVALYVDKCHKQASYLNVYAPVISPFPGPDQWLKVADIITIKPPLHKK